MKLEQLTYFLEAAKTEHIGKAAKSLAISPSAISHSIALLEEELGRELFIKKGKRIHLTTHGKVLMERTSQLLLEVQSIQDDIRSETAELQGTYKMAASHDLCLRFLTPSWSQLQKLNPRLVGEIYTLRSAQVVAGAVSGEYDLGLCFNPVEHPDLNCKKLYTGQLQLVVRKDHPVLKKKETERFAELSHYPAALPKSFQGIDVCERHPMFEKFKIKLKPQFLFDSYGVGIHHVASSDTWSLIPDWLIQEQKSALKAIQPSSGWDAPYHLAVVWSKDRLLTEVIKQMTSLIASKLPS